MASHQWRFGRREPFGDASAVYERLEQIRNKEELTRDAILADARKTSSPLHSRLEWHDGTAAEKFRRIQISRIMSTLVKPDGSRVYMKVRASKDQPIHFDLVSRVLKNPELRRPIARRALLQLQNWESLYGEIPELKDALKALQRAVRTTISPALKEMEEATV